jgi:uncharacterized protein
MQRALAVVVVVVCIATVATAQPQVPALTGRVVDNADLLSPQTERVLTEQLRAHADSTSNQIAVLTIESLEGAVLEQYSIEVARAWELGQEEFDNGVLVLVAEQERDIRIEVGYGLEGALPDVVASRIIRYEMTPRFRQGDFDGGVRAGVDAILGAIAGTYEPPTNADGGSSWWETRLVGLLFSVFGGLFGFGAIYTSLRTAARGGWVPWLILLIFVGPFALVGTIFFVSGFSLLLFGETVWAVGFGLMGFAVVFVAFFGASVWLIRHPKLRALREKAEADEAIEKTIRIAGLTFGPSFWASSAIQSMSSSSSGSSGWSSGGGGFSSGGGGGFSGGGGSFGGGGASGGW